MVATAVEIGQDSWQEQRGRAEEKQSRSSMHSTIVGRSVLAIIVWSVSRAADHE